MLILTPEGIIAARNLLGRTPLVIGERDGDYAVASESHRYVNLGYRNNRFIGPGEEQHQEHILDFCPPIT